MIEQVLKSFFDPYLEVPIEAWGGFSMLLTPFNFNKNDLLKESGKKETHLHLITKGSAGLFVHKDGHDTCVDLCFEGHFTGDYYSLLIQQNTHAFHDTSEMSQLISNNSPIYVMALEPLETLAIKKEDLFSLYKNSEIGGRIARMIAEVLFIQKQQQQIELLTQTAEQRYLKLLEMYPTILQRTANKNIASYLGITPESFSRLQKKVVR